MTFQIVGQPVSLGATAASAKSGFLQPPAPPPAETAPALGDSVTAPSPGAAALAPAAAHSLASALALEVRPLARPAPAPASASSHASASAPATAAEEEMVLEEMRGRVYHLNYHVLLLQRMIRGATIEDDASDCPDWWPRVPPRPQTNADVAELMRWRAEESLRAARDAEAEIEHRRMLREKPIGVLRRGSSGENWRFGPDDCQRNQHGLL